MTNCINLKSGQYVFFPRYTRTRNLYWSRLAAYAALEKMHYMFQSENSLLHIPSNRISPICQRLLFLISLFENSGKGATVKMMKQ